MNASPLMLASAGALLALASVALLFGGNGSDRRLRERVKSTQDIKVQSSGSIDDLLIGTSAKVSPVMRVAAMLGYRSDLPPPFSMSLRIIVPLAVVIGLVGFKIASLTLPPALAVATGCVATLFGASVLFRRKTNAYMGSLFNQIPDTMSLMLRAVRAGLPVAEAIRSVSRESLSPTREEFKRVAGEAALGMPIEVTLRRLFDRTQIQEYAFFSVVIGLHAQTGGNLSETLENLADMVRRRVAMAGKARALAAEGRLSAIVVAALPFVVGVLISFLNPGYMNEFANNPHGPMLIVVFTVLLGLGLLVSNLLIKRSTQD